MSVRRHRGTKGVRPIKEPRESQVVSLWQRLLQHGVALTTAHGEVVEVLYPGRPNDGRGADFRDAIISTADGLVRGDIEFHVQPGDWYAHRHHHNPAYNSVVLHVVWRQDNPGLTGLQNGKIIPTVALNRHFIERYHSFNSASPPAINVPCSRRRDSPALTAAADLLAVQGDKRFLAKASSFRADIARCGAGQTLYQGMMAALGYAKNKLPFLELAQRLPLPNLEAAALKETTADGCLTRLQALLLGAAGLLPSQRPAMLPDACGNSWATALEKHWASLGHRQLMDADCWDTFRVRPANQPTRRLLAMAHLLFRCRERGLLAEMLDLVRQAPPEKGHHQLEEGLTVSGFGSRIRTLSPLLGRARAADIAVNVLLPFAFAWGRLTAHPELERKSLELYRGYPRLVTNSIERHMLGQVGLNRGLVNSARCQQGLIHIYHTRCTQGKCTGCPLSLVNHPSLRPGITSRPMVSSSPA